MYPKQIRRNASHQLAAIFPNIQSAKLINPREIVETRIMPPSDFGTIERVYKMCTDTKLSQISEHEFELNIGGGTRYVFSTKEQEAIAPVATKETEQAIAHTESTPVEEVKPAQEQPAAKNDYPEIEKVVDQKATLLLINTFGMPVVRQITIKKAEMVVKDPTKFYLNKPLLQLTYVLKGKRKVYKTRYESGAALYLGWHEVKTPSSVVCFEGGLIDRLKSQIDAAPIYEQVDC